MASDNYRFYHLAVYISLFFCLALSLFYTVTMTVTRKRDLDRYSMQREFFATNIYNAVNFYLDHYFTNRLTNTSSSTVSDKPSNYPTISYSFFGFSNYPQPTVIFPGDIQLVVGDYCDYGLIVKLTDRSVYCVTPSNTIHIIRSDSRYIQTSQAESDSVAQPRKPEYSEIGF